MLENRNASQVIESLPIMMVSCFQSSFIKYSIYLYA